MKDNSITQMIHNIGNIQAHISPITFTYLTSYIENYSDLFRRFQREAVLKAESLLALKKWLTFSQHNSVVFPSFSFILNTIFLGEGLCAAVIVEYFSRFFQSYSPLKAMPLPLEENPQKILDVSFYHVNPGGSQLEEKTRRLRFLQAVYKIESAFSTFRYFPKQILKRENLELVRRVPEVKSANLSFPISEIFTIIKELEAQSNKGSGYLLCLEGPLNHGFGLYLKAPYHFVDPAHGLAVSDNKHDLLLFLANYLAEKYPDYHSFALLEFSATQIESASASQASEA